jgi:hypothetical protein
MAYRGQNNNDWRNHPNFQNYGPAVNKGGYNNNYNGGYNAPPPPPKRSGAKFTMLKDGKHKGLYIVNAWNTSKSRGMITAKVAPYHASDKIVTSEKGNEYVKMMASIFYKRTGQTLLMPCLMNQETQVIVLKDLGMVITPNGTGRTRSGKAVSGYFGTMFK